jgi:hypothetical protein
MVRSVKLSGVGAMFAAGCSSGASSARFVSFFDSGLLVMGMRSFLAASFSALDEPLLESCAATVLALVDDRVTRRFGSGSVAGAESEVLRRFGGILTTES